MADGTVKIDIILEDGRVAKGVADLDSKLGGLGGSGEKASLGIGKIASALGLVYLAKKGIDMVKSSVDGAITRFDTMKQFPRVMEMIGFDAGESSQAIDKLSDGVQGLPTRLDAVTSTAQNIAVMTGDLDGAVDTTLALNNAFLASGSSSADAERGLTQYTQMLSKGEVDLQSWRTLQETMGVALTTVAKDFGFTGKAAQNDLYDALKSGEITMEDFNAGLVEASERQGGFADMAKEASKGIRTSWENIKTAFVIGTAKVITSIDDILDPMGGISGVMDKFKDVASQAFDYIVTVLPGVISSVLALYNIIKPFLPAIMAIATGILTVVTAYAAFAKVKAIINSIRAATLLMNAAILANPIGVIVAIIIAAALLIYIYWEPISTFFMNLWSSISEAFSIAWGAISDFGAKVIEKLKLGWTNATEGIKELWNNMIDFFTGIGESISNAFTTSVDKVKEVFSIVYDWLNDKTNGVFGEYVDIITSYLTAAQEVIKAIWDYIKATFTNAMAFIKALVTLDFQGMKDAIDNQMQAVRNVISTIWNAISTYIQSVLSSIKNIISIVWSGIRSVITTIMSAIGSLISRNWNAIKSVITSVMNVIRSVISSIWNSIRSLISSVVNSISNTISSIFNALKGITSSAFNNVKDAVSNGINGALDVVLGIKDSFFNAGKNIVNAIGDGISKAAGAVKDKMRDLVGGLRDMLPFSPAKVGPLRDIMDIQLAQSVGKAIEKGKPSALKSMRGLTGSLSDEANEDLGLSARLNSVSAEALIGKSLVDNPKNNKCGSHSVTNQNNTTNMSSMFKGAIFNVRDDNDIKKIAKELNEHIKMQARKGGVIM